MLLPLLIAFDRRHDPGIRGIGSPRRTTRQAGVAAPLFPSLFGVNLIHPQAGSFGAAADKLQAPCFENFLQFPALANSP